MMKSSHLSDEILQEYLLNEIQDASIATHLTVCSICRKRLEEYEFLIDCVQKIETETFSFNVSTLVMNHITLYEKKKSKRQALIFWGLLALVFIAIASFSIPYFPAVLSIFDSKPMATTLLIIGTGSLVLLYLLADIIQQYKSKEEKLFRNNLQPKL